MTLPSVSTLATALFAASIALSGLSFPDDARAQGSESNVGPATVESAGRLRMLASRANRQYLIYQFRIDFQTSKEPLLQTVEEFDQTMSLLRSGSDFSDVVAPPNQAVSDGLDEVAAAWKDLRRVYTYNSVQVRRAKDLLPQPERLADPYLVGFVDRLSGNLLTAADALVEQYVVACSGACGAELNRAARQRALLENITSDILFIVLGLDTEKHETSLASHRDQFDNALKQLRAAASDRSNALANLDTIAGYWRQIQNVVEMALGGDVDSIDVNFLLRIHDRLAGELDDAIKPFAAG